MVVPYAERKDYKVPSIMGLKREGIGPTRQWIVENCGGRVLMLDDDLDFFVRRKDDHTKLIKASPADISRMLTAVHSALDRYAHVGIAVREGANRDTRPIIENTRLLRALAYRTDVMLKHKVRFDRSPVMEDFDVALQLLELGYPSACINGWAQDQPGSNTAGGCSTYRTSEVQAQGATTLAKLHPDFVTVVEKPPLKSGGWDGKPRLDVRIQWKKAFESAGVVREL